MFKIKPFRSFIQNQGNWRVWPGRCEYLVRLRHAVTRKRIQMRVQNEGKIEMRKQKGFSLIELLIVVAIILIIAAIAIPNLMRAKMAANDSSAAAGERTIVTGEVGYYAAYPTIGYTSLAALGGATGAACVPSTTTACLIDNNLSNNGPGGLGKSGYNFAANP